MKLLVIGNEQRVAKFTPDLPITHDVEVVVKPVGTSDDALLVAASDADFVQADAIAMVSARLIEGMPNLKLIHSEGVAYNGIDCAAAAARGIPVCNNRGANADSVAEQTILLILGLMKHVREGDRAVRAGHQIELKEKLMVSGIAELTDATVGLVGFGAIGQAVAVRLRAFGTRVVYNKRHPLDAAREQELGVEYLPLDELLACSDFVSLHVPVTPQTKGMADDAFFARMKEGSCLVNTARGDLVDNEACVRALASGHLAGAAFDTLAPEPVTADNPLVAVPDDLADRVLFSPHIGGVTENMFRRAYRTIWENIARVASDEQLVNRVN